MNPKRVWVAFLFHIFHNFLCVHLTNIQKIPEIKAAVLFSNCVPAAYKSFSSSHPHTLSSIKLMLCCSTAVAEKTSVTYSVCVYALEPPALDGLSSSKHVFFIICVCAHCHTTNKEDAAGNLCTIIFRCFCALEKLIKKYNVSCVGAVFSPAKRVSSIIWIWRDVLNALVRYVLWNGDMNKSDGGSACWISLY